MYHCPLSFLAIQSGREIKASSFSKSQLETQSPLNVIVCQLTTQCKGALNNPDITVFACTAHNHHILEQTGKSVLIDKVNYPHCPTETNLSFGCSVANKNIDQDTFYSTLFATRNTSPYVCISLSHLAISLGVWLTVKQPPWPCISGRRVAMGPWYVPSMCDQINSGEE